MAITTITRPGARRATPPAISPTARSRNFGSVSGYLGRTVLALFFLFPIVFMFVSSLKPDDQIFADLSSPRAFLPVVDISLDNYRSVFETVHAGRFLANSIGI